MAICWYTMRLMSMSKDRFRQCIYRASSAIDHGDGLQVRSMFQQSGSKLSAPRVPPQPADPSPPRRSISQSGNSSSVHNGIHFVIHFFLPLIQIDWCFCWYSQKGVPLPGLPPRRPPPQAPPHQRPSLHISGPILTSSTLARYYHLFWKTVGRCFPLIVF